MEKEELKRRCLEAIDANRDKIIALGTAIYQTPELGYKEFRSTEAIANAFRELGYEPPEFFHVPLLVAPDGRRLAKRDKDLDMSALRERYTPEQVIGILAWWAGLLKKPEPVSAADLTDGFSWGKVAKEDVTAVMPF